MLDIYTTNIFRWLQTSVCIQTNTSKRKAQMFLWVYITSPEQFGIWIVVQKVHLENLNLSIAYEVCTFFL